MIDEIVSAVASGVPLAVICRGEGMPNPSTFYDWVNADETLSQRFTRARDVGFDAIAADCLAIADETGDDTIIGERGEPRPNSEWITRSRLRVETRLKLLAKWDPRRYGDKLDLTSAGERLPETPVEDTAARIAALLAKGLERQGETE